MPSFIAPSLIALLMELKDRILVMADHKVAGELPAKSREHEIMLMATGHSDAKIAAALAGKE